jgi:hypothetical protein
MEIEIALDTSTALKDWQEFRRKVVNNIQDNDYIGKVKQDLQDWAEIIGYNSSRDIFDYSSITSWGNSLSKVNQLAASINDGSYKNTYASGIFWGYSSGLSDAIDDLRAYKEDLENELEDIQDTLDQFWEDYVDAWSYIVEQMDKQSDKFAAINTAYDHQRSIITTLYGSDAYDRLYESYQAQLQNNLSTIEWYQKLVDYYTDIKE